MPYGKSFGARQVRPVKSSQMSYAGQELLHLPGQSPPRQILVELFSLTVAAEAARHESRLQARGEDDPFVFISLVVTAAA